MSKENNERAAEGAPGDKVRASATENEQPDETTTDNSESEGTEVPITDGEGASDDRVLELQEEVLSLKDQLLRKQADFDNFRKRMVRERSEAVKYANSSLLLDLVEVIDNFERAIKSAEESENFHTFHEGIALIEKQFISMLENKWGLKRLDSVGEEFDPEKHQAIAAEESPDADVQTVVEDYQKGYVLHDRVLRPARVKVLMPASNDGSGSESEDETDNRDEKVEE